MLRRIAIFVLLAAHSIVVLGQKNDSILVNSKDTIAYRYTPMPKSPSTSGGIKRNRQKISNYILNSTIDQSFDKRVDMTFAPTLYYTLSTSVGLAIAAAGRYRLDKQNRDVHASDFSVYATASLTGFYRVGLRGNNIFKNDHQRIVYNAEFFSQPTRFWGVGYNAAMENSSLRYLASRTIVDVRFLQRVAKGLFIGAGADYNYHFGKFGGGKYASKDEFIVRLDGDRVEYRAVGVSLFVEFDTRDAVSNPQRGLYVAAQAKMRPNGLGNMERTLWSGRLLANYYQKIWKGAVLAIDLRGELNSPGTPWVYNAQLGGASAMRGYYAGRFNDLCAITLQAELRQKIYKGFGAAAWGGVGNIFSSFGEFDLHKTLPTYGVGLRYGVKHNMNIRLDYGFGGRDHRGKLIHGAVFSINEAF